MQIQTIRFQRKKEDKWEAGIAIQTSVKNLIVDKESCVVRKVYDYKPIHNGLLIDLSGTLQSIEKLYGTTGSK